MRVNGSDLLNRITIHYRDQFIYQIHKVLGSADFLGNPVGALGEDIELAVVAAWVGHKAIVGASHDNVRTRTPPSRCPPRAGRPSPRTGLVARLATRPLQDARVG